MRFPHTVFNGRSTPARFLLLHAVLILVPMMARAQATGTVSGIVRDAGTHAPMKGATAILRDPSDSTRKPLGNLSNDKGAFSIDHAVIGRTYTLEVVYVGYQRHTATGILLTADRPNLNVGEIPLTQTAIDGGGVEVTSERQQVVVMADKTVYGVENNPAYTATNVSELLGQTPSVAVDQDGKVSLRGKENVTIMINDRPLTMPADQQNKFLQSLPANSVKEIEIRTNPGAQFDAKNGGGIINIVTRRTMSDLFGGNLSAGVDSRLGGNTGAGLYYNGKDLNASLGGGLYHGSGHGSSTSLRLNYRDSNEQRDQADGTSTSTSNSHNGYGQIDYRFTESDLVSLSFNLHGWSSDYTSHGAHTFYNLNNAIVERSYDTSGPISGSGNSGDYNSASLLLKHEFGKDHKLSLDVSYNANGYVSNSEYSSTYFRADGELDSARVSGRSSTYDQKNSTIITSLNYDNPISDKLTISLGGKNETNSLDDNTSVRSLDRATGEYILDATQTNHYLPTNSIYAAYGNAAYRPIKELGIQAGLRFERATVSAKYASGEPIISRNYSNFFPSGSLSYNITDAQSLTFSYRRSLALPDIDVLNPVKIKWSDFYEASGNPDLDPEFTQSLELNYNTFWGAGNMISVAPYYSITTGSIESTQRLLNGVTYSTTANFNGAYSLGSEVSVSLRPFDWFNFRGSINLFMKVNRGSDIPGDVYSSALGNNGNASLNADLMKGTTLSTNLFFNTPAQVGESRQSGFVYWNVSLRQRLLENKLSISLSVNDPLNLQQWHNVYESPDFRSESTSKWLTRYVGLNVSYTFGTTPRMETHKQEKSDTKGSSGSGGSGGSGE
ncbi:MAG: Outer rane receptor protein [Chlorobi bacterium]|nr:Outer rane receptor protein [Chlorobiota bacterium]